MRVVKSHDPESLSRYRYTLFMLKFLRAGIIVIASLCVIVLYFERHITPALFSICLIVMLLAHFHFQDVYSGLSRTNQTFYRQLRLMKETHGTFYYTAFYVRITIVERASAERIVFRANHKELASYKLTDFNIEVGENRFVAFYPENELEQIEHFDAYLFSRDKSVVSHKDLRKSLIEGDHHRML